MKAGRGSTSPSALKLAERRSRAVRLRVAGATYEQIGDALQVHRGTAFRDVAAGLDTAMQEPVREVIVLEVRRLDRLLAAVWPAALNGDLGAVKVALAIAARRAQLCGLDQPTQSVVTLSGPIPPVDRGAAVDAALAAFNEVVGDPRPNPESATISATYAAATPRRKDTR